MVGEAGQIIVGVSGSPASLEALREGVAQARLSGRPLLAILAWAPPGGEVAARRGGVPPGLLQVWRDDAATRLRTAFDEALGGVPSDVKVRLQIARGAPARVLLEVAEHAEDTVVISTGTAGWWRRLCNGSVARQCAARTQCRLLIVPAPPMVRALGHPGLVRRMARRGPALPSC